MAIFFLIWGAVLVANSDNVVRPLVVMNSLHQVNGLLVFIALAIGSFFAAPSAAALARRHGPRWVVTLGMALEAVGIEVEMQSMEFSAFFPLWLGSLPALLKAFLEQVLRPGFAFDTGKAFSGRLKGRSARVIVTMGMPAWVYRLWFHARGTGSFASHSVAIWCQRTD